MNPDANLVEEIRNTIEGELPSLEALYRHFHAHPELSGREEKTSERLEEEISLAGFATVRGIGGYGVVGVLSSGEGPVVMIRADMDALPVTEETGLSYASKVEAQTPDGSRRGVMHACGHDAHMAVMVGTGRLLQAFSHRWKGTVVLVGQPSEEVGNGAERMILDGLFEKFPRPDFALALHVGPDLPMGTIGYREGAFSAGSDSMVITLRGIGGLAAHPEKTKDPVILAARTILALQTIV
ncbi:MAG TPA: amidohydrolase, partial [Methanoregulaceae archaeon]|nr:amidohydrolase [Methanoregulaceae archaeon]